MRKEAGLTYVLQWLVASFPEVGEAVFSDSYINKISGGISNESYRVVTGDYDWVVRLRKCNKASYLLDIEIEIKLLKSAAEADLVPVVVKGDPVAGILVTQYLKESKPWTQNLSRQHRNITRIANRLREFHQIDMNLETYRPLGVSQSYIDEAGSLCERDRAWGKELITYATNYERCYRPKVVCHNDLVAENILDDGTLRFIDLEYAVTADPILDLASLVAMNNFDRDQASYLLYNYYGGEPPCSTQSFFNVVRMTHLLSYFWCLSRMQEAEDSSPFKLFAAEIAAMLR